MTTNNIFYAVLENGKPCLYKAEESPSLGWTKYIYPSLEDAQEYLMKYLGIYAPKNCLSVGEIFHLYDENSYQIVELDLKEFINGN